MEKNKVKFGLNKVHWAKILSYQEDGTPNYGEVKRLPGAVNLSIDASGDNPQLSSIEAVLFTQAR